MEFNQVIEFVDFFDRPQVYTTTGGVNGWAIKDTSAAGSPTYLNVNGGGAKLTLAATNEVEVVTLYFADLLMMTIGELQTVEFLIAQNLVDADATLTFGVASAQNDTTDSITTNAWFKLAGSAAVVVETDDNVVDNDDVATGVSLTSNTVKRFMIDFTFGRTDIRFYIDGDRVAKGTTFNMNSAANNNVQPFIQLQKGANTVQHTATLLKYRHSYNKLMNLT